VHGHGQEWQAEARAAHEQCVRVLYLGAVGMGGAVLYDAANLYRWTM